MSGKKKEKKVEKNEQNEPSPEALFLSIREQQVNRASFSGQPNPEAQSDQMLSKMITMLSEVLTNVTDMAITVKHNKRMISELNVKADALGDKVNEILEHIPNLAPERHEHGRTIQHPGSKFQLVKSVEDLEALNTKSCDPDFVQATISHFSRLHGKGRYVGEGLTVCHQLINSFFDPTFLLSCSWTGAGRNVKKIPFQRYGNVIELFFRVVLNSDPLFSKVQTESFLHQCLRNAKQRVQNKGGKKPVSRKRKLIRGLPESSTEEERGAPETDEEEEIGQSEDDYDIIDEAEEHEKSSELSLKIEILDEQVLD
uniref:DUF4806 domain-containing protein n=1 Tax=Culex tarsalis TaxID=7177 RepID=A0A1Q3FW77_CULTA